MSDVLTAVPGRKGHFRLESGYHTNLWLDLDGLFAEPTRIRPVVDRLADAIRPYQFTAVCGPLVGGAFLAQQLASLFDVEFIFTERVVPTNRDGLYQVQYLLPKGLHDRVRAKPIAIVDDVISAGSAVGGTYRELRARGAEPTVVGALLVLGSAALSFFEEEHVPVESVDRLPFELWLASECPLCAAKVPLEDLSSSLS